MRICLVSRRNITRDPVARALVNSLDSAGHRITVVCAGSPQPGLPDKVQVVTVAAGRSLWRSFRRRARRASTVKGDALDQALHRAVIEARPELIYPRREDDVSLVDDIGVPVVRRPEWRPPSFDLINLAPYSVELSSSPALPTGPFHLRREQAVSVPRPGRHAGSAVVIAYRVTPTNPGRYLEAALRRSGASVTVLNGTLDWSQVPPGASFVVIVESPYPALEQQGAKPRVPVLFWIHHGEHHLPTNLRLVRRYGASAVLLAHSWHLAHRFAVPVHRFPFAVAPELSTEPKPWAERSYDVAMVGAGVGGSGGRYDRRRELVEALEGYTSIRTRFSYGLGPEEMIALYQDARIVINEGGRRHLPITMRVFEALGAGALLLTEDLPGTDTLLKRGEHYVPMTEDVPDQVRHLLDSAESSAIAAAGRRWAWDRHTYDHRVDQLFEIASTTSPAPIDLEDSFRPRTPLAAVVDRDVETQHLATFGQVDAMGLDDRAVRFGDAERLRESSIDAVVIGRGPVAELKLAVLAARGYVYAEGEHSAAVETVLADHRPDAIVSYDSGFLRADLGGTGYRMRPADHPLAQ